MKRLEVLFWDKGYRNYNGKKIKVIDMFTKKQKFLPPEEWVMFKDETGEIVPAKTQPSETSAAFFC